MAGNGGNPAPYVPPIENTAVGGGDFAKRPDFGARSVASAAAYAPGTLTVNSGSTVGRYQTPDSFMFSGATVSPTQINSNAPLLVPLAQMQPLILQWAYSQSPADQAKYKAIVAQMQQAKLVTEKGTPALSSVVSAWDQVLTGASFNKQYAPLEYLGVLAQQGATNITGSSPDGGPTTSTSSSTNTELVLTNKFNAHALVDNALGQYLGRRATESELAQFRSLLRDQEKSNPVVTTSNSTSTTTPTASGDSTSTSSTAGTRKGGSNGEVIAKEFAQSRGDYAETQAATTGMDWLTEAVMGMSKERMI